jgi:putative phosphoesterase
VGVAVFVVQLQDAQPRLTIAGKIHGHVHNLKNLPPLAPGDVLLHGHTHIPAWTEFGEGNLYLNPGSVSIPKEGSAHSYMTLEGETFLWKTLEGEVYRELEL